MTALLEVRDLSIDFGGIRALHEVSFEVQENEICGLIGPNGAGKTTLFNAISRIYAVDSGTIRYAGKNITATRADRIIELGIARTFQNIGLFGKMSVLENVLLGAHHRFRPGFLKAIFGRGAASVRREVEHRARAVLAEIGLGAVSDHLVDGLPFGTLKRVEFARALLSRPSLLLLDEPANGLSHGEVDELAELILWARSQYHLTILMVEHHMRMLMRISDRVVVLENGIKIAEGMPTEVKTDARVAAAYLGASR